MLTIHRTVLPAPFFLGSLRFAQKTRPVIMSVSGVVSDSKEWTGAYGVDFYAKQVFTLSRIVGP